MTSGFKITTARKLLEEYVRSSAWEWVKYLDVSAWYDERWAAVWHDDGTVAVEADGVEFARFRLGVAVLRVDSDPQIVEIYTHHVLIGDQLQGKSGAWFPITEVRMAGNGDWVYVLDVNGAAPKVTKPSHTKIKVRRCPDGVAADLLMNEFPNAEIDRESE